MCVVCVWVGETCAGMDQSMYGWANSPLAAGLKTSSRLMKSRPALVFVVAVAVVVGVVVVVVVAIGVVVVVVVASVVVVTSR